MNENDVLTQTSGNYTLSIWRDDFPPNPREEFDNLGTLYIPRPPRGCSFSDKDANADDAKAAPVKIPVYILDHSGLAISAAPFGDPWDSWQAGVLYVTAEKLKEEYTDRSYEEAEKTALNVLRAELQEFADYIAGDVYGFTITDNRDGDISPHSRPQTIRSSPLPDWKMCGKVAALPHKTLNLSPLKE